MPPSHSPPTLEDGDISPGVPSDHPREPSTAASSITSPSTTLGVPIAARRSHKKSRTGCQTCKVRKIKCDERHPACLNCISHGVECPFLTAPSKPKRRSSNESPVPAPSDPAATQGGSDELPMFELELLHNFTVHTYLTMASDSDVRDFWRVNVVEMGLECDFTMRALLAVSALHLAYNRPAKREFYTTQAIMYHQKASRSAMAVMGNIKGTEDAVNLFVFSILTIYFALASPRRPDGYFFGNEAGIPDWAFLLGGAKRLGDVMDVESEHERLEPFLAYGHRRWNARMTKDGPQFDTLRELRQHIVDAVTDEVLLATYTFAIDELDRSLLASQDPSAPNDVLDAMIWLWSVWETLMPLLKVPEQEAVTIFAYFGILLKHYESQWFLQGWADHLVSRAFDILDEEHRTWISLPLEEIGLTAATAMS